MHLLASFIEVELDEFNMTAQADADCPVWSKTRLKHKAVSVNEWPYTTAVSCGFTDIFITPLLCTYLTHNASYKNTAVFHQLVIWKCFYVLLFELCELLNQLK